MVHLHGLVTIKESQDTKCVERLSFPRLETQSGPDCTTVSGSSFFLNGGEAKDTDGTKQPMHTYLNETTMSQLRPPQCRVKLFLRCLGCVARAVADDESGRNYKCWRMKMSFYQAVEEKMSAGGRFSCPCTEVLSG